MSQTPDTYMIIKIIYSDGEVGNYQRLKPANKFAAFIWCLCADKFLGGKPMVWLEDAGSQQLLDLVFKPELPEHWRTLLKLTWPWVIIPKQDLMRVADHMETVIRELDPTKVENSHLSAIQMILRQCSSASTLLGVCFHATTEMVDTWWVPEVDGKGERPYNIIRDKYHVRIFDHWTPEVLNAKSPGPHSH